jgi:hypothetical protein
MKRTSLAALGVAAALVAPAAFAASGDAWHGTNAYREYAPVEITTRPAERVYWYEERTAPVVIERRYVYEPRYDAYDYPEPIYVARADDDWVKDLNPQTGHRIGDGLFNKQGPNDFGQ